MGIETRCGLHAAPSRGPLQPAGPAGEVRSAGVEGQVRRQFERRRDCGETEPVPDERVHQVARRRVRDTQTGGDAETVEVHLRRRQRVGARLMAEQADVARDEDRHVGVQDGRSFCLHLVDPIRPGFIGPGLPHVVHQENDGAVVVADIAMVWEYEPLGPFQAKAFATTISPWVATQQAQAASRRSGDARLRAGDRCRGPRHLMKRRPVE